MSSDLALPTPRSFEQWTTGLHKIVAIRKGLRRALGDWLLLGEDTFGEKIWQVISDTGFSEGDLRNMMSLCRNIPVDEWTPAIPWSWWQAMVPLDKETREQVITRALSGDITRDEIRLLSHSNGSGNGNGQGPEKPDSTLPDAVSVLENALAVAYVTVGKLCERRERGPLTVAALDELIDAGMALRERLAPK